MSNNRPQLYKAPALENKGGASVTTGEKLVLDADYLQKHQRLLHVQAMAEEMILQAQKQVESVKANAEAEAQRLVETAHNLAMTQGQAEYEGIVQAAYDEGFKAGHEAGYLDICNAMADKIQVAESIVDKAFEAEQRILLKHQPMLTDLVGMLVREVLKAELRLAPEQLGTLVETAINRIQPTGVAKIILHGETLQQLKATSPDILARLTSGENIIFQSDLNCGPQDLYLNTVEASFDISPLTQADTYVHLLGQRLLPRADVDRLEAEALPALETAAAPEVTA